MYTDFTIRIYTGFMISRGPLRLVNIRGFYKYDIHIILFQLEIT